ncbi:UNVERIFIED_CONTAM: hypothetical protein FKN15_012587 [Acipenser sinensis]
MKGSRIELGDVTPHNIKQLKRLNQVIFPVSYNEKFYKDVLEVGELAKLAEEIKRLRKQQEDLRKENGHYIELLKANGINFQDDPTVHWRGNMKKAKVAMVIPTHQVQKGIIVFSNCNKVNPSCPEAVVQNVVVNAGPSLQEPTADPVTIQNLCNVTVPELCWKGPQLQDIAPTTCAKQQAQPNLPTTLSTTKNSIANYSSARTVQNTQTLPVSVSQNVLHSCTQDLPDCFTTSTGVQTHTALSAASSKPQTANSAQTIPANVTTSNLLHLQPLHLQQIKSNSVLQEPALQASLQASPLRTLISEKLATIALNKSTSVANHSMPPTATAQVLTSINTLPCLDNTCAFPCSSSSISNDLNSVNTFTRITSGNTQTTWTTLQLAGNTVQPLNQMPSGILPTSMNETLTNASLDSGILNGCNIVAPVGFKGTSLCPAGSQQVHSQIAAVSLPSLHSVPVQPVLAQPQIAIQPQPNVLPLLQAMQVIQMTNPAGATVPQAGANPNVVILQPANTGPTPAVVREGIASQTPCQQIVIIQAANQNAVLQNQQTTVAPSAVPVANHVVTSSCPVQTPSLQTVGGKHLVHILPRPLAASDSQQQAQTISVNGQIFALQPVKPSLGVCNQNPMQIVQPTTCEDPTTNVALNTLGALSNLNQSISQMAGQSRVPLSVGQTSTQGASSTSSQINNPTSNISVSASSTSTPSNSALSVCSISKNICSSSAVKMLKKPSTPAGSKPKRTSSKKSKSAKQRSSPLKASKPTCSQPSNVDVQPQLPSKETLFVSEHLTAASESTSNTPVTSSSPLVVSSGLSQSAPSKEYVAKEPVATTASSCSAPAESVTVQQPGLITPALCAEETALTLPQTTFQDSQTTNVSSTNTSSSESLSCIMTNISELSAQISMSCLNTLPLQSIGCETGIMESQNKLLSCSRSGTSATSVSFPEPKIQRPESTITSSSSSSSSSSSIAQARSIAAEPKQTTANSEINKDKISSHQFTFQGDANTSFSRSKEPPSSDLTDKEDHNRDILLVNNKENAPQQQACVLDHEGVGSSLLSNRQSDSPMSTSSGSSRGFSVASMLPNANREDVPCVGTSGNTYNSFSFSEQADILALAATAIFDQESQNKKGVSSGSEVPVHRQVSVNQQPPSVNKEKNGSQQPKKIQEIKEGIAKHTEVQPVKLPSQVQLNSERPKTVSSSSAGTNLPVLISASQSTTSAGCLSVNNLIRQNTVSQPYVCSNLNPADHPPVSVNMPRSSSSSFTTQCSGPTQMLEYTHKNIAMRSQVVLRYQSADNRQGLALVPKTWLLKQVTFKLIL